MQHVNGLAIRAVPPIEPLVSAREQPAEPARVDSYATQREFLPDPPGHPAPFASGPFVPSRFDLSAQWAPERLEHFREIDRHVSAVDVHSEDRGPAPRALPIERVEPLPILERLVVVPE